MRDREIKKLKSEPSGGLLSDFERRLIKNEKEVLRKYMGQTVKGTSEDASVNCTLLTDKAVQYLKDMVAKLENDLEQE